MSLKCSVFGHNYGDTERRRNREENGTELVETTQEIKACIRCGDTLVVSEATEVKTLEAPDATTGVGADAGQQDRTDADGRDETDRRDGTEQEEGTARGGAETETADQRDRQSTEAGQREEQIKRINTRDTGRGDTPRSGEATTRNGAATVGQGEADGGVEQSDAGTSPGSRSGSGRSGATSSGPAGDTGTADTADARSRETSTTGTEDTPVSRKNDAFIIDEDGEERRPTEWPGPDGGDGDDTADAEDWEPDVDADDTDRAPEPATRSTAGHTVPEGEFYCPKCEFTTLVKFASSLREGDFCPECHRAALEHRPE